MSLTVTLYTRANCPLCDKAKAAIHAAGLGIRDEIDVDSDPELQAKYTNDVPVVLINGKEAFRHRVDPDELAAIVRGRRVNMAGLSSEKCVPCRGGVPPLKGDELQSVVLELGRGWKVIDDHHLEKTYVFPDFARAMAFTNRIGALAEAEGHHPDIHLSWGKVTVQIWTHKIDGLTRSDFVLASKIDDLPAG